MPAAFTDETPAPVPKRGEGPNGLAILAFVGFGMLFGILFLAWLGTPRIKPAVGQTLNKLDLKPLAYAETPLSENDLQGKVTLLHFWGTWCGPCREEFPEFVELARELANNPAVQVISVSSSPGPEYDLSTLAEETRQFMDEFSAQVPTYADPAGLTRSQAGLLLPDASLTYPSTFLLDRQAMVVGVWVGYDPGGLDAVRKRVQAMVQ